MKAKIVPIGTSKGLRLPKKLIDELGFGDEVELEVRMEGIMIKPVVKDEFDNQMEVAKFMYHFTGYTYSFAISSSRKWGSEDSPIENRGEGYYQLMPDHIDDGFFDWYCDNRPYYQFFDTKEKAMLYFLKYWWEWRKKSSPKVFEINYRTNQINTTMETTTQGKINNKGAAYQLAKVFTAKHLFGDYRGFEGVIRYIKDSGLVEPEKIKFGTEEIILRKELFETAVDEIVELDNNITLVGLQREIMQMLDNIFANLKRDEKFLAISGLDQKTVDYVVKKIATLRFAS